MENPEAFLDDQLSRKIRHFIPQTLRAAYTAANQLIENEPILQVQSAQDNKGRIIQYAVDLAFEKI